MIESLWKRRFSYSSRPTLGPPPSPNLLCNGYQLSFPGENGSPPTPSSAEVKERVELYICSPLCIHAGYRVNPIFIFIYHHNHHYHKSVMELGHLLTRSVLTYPEVSSKVCHDSFFQLGSSVSLLLVTYFEAFYLHVVSSFSCVPVIFPKLVLFLNPLQFVHLFCNLSQVYPAVLLMYFISAALILLASLALTVQVSLPYNKTGRTSVLYSFILVFFMAFCGLNTLFKIPVIFKIYLICYQCPILLHKISDFLNR